MTPQEERREALKREFAEELNKIGVHHVRLRMEKNLYAGTRLIWVTEWLAQFDKADAEDNAEFKREAKATARSAKNAAWAAAIAAIIAAIAAIISLVITFSAQPHP